MASMMIFYLCVNIFVLVAADGSTPAPDSPLTATVLDVEEDYVTFQVSGSSEVSGVPIKSIKVDYHSESRVRRNRTEKPVTSVDAYNNTMLSEKEFSQTITVKNLEAGRLYTFNFIAINENGQYGPPSADLPVFLLPATPDVDIRHVQDAKLIISWGTDAIGHEDFYTVAYEKDDNPGCNVTLSVSTCFGNQYSFDDLQRKTTYTFTIRSHNPSGYSKPAQIVYPID